LAITFSSWGILKKAKSIFGSNVERHAFNLIKAELPAGWAIHSNLPLSQVVEIEKTEVTVGDWDFYLKTSVDFVLTDPQGEPRLALEFDGLAGGFSSGSAYHPARANAIRERAINFKLALCSKAGLPLYVISFDEIRSLSDDESLCIVHSVVAQQIVLQKMDEKLRHWDENERGRGKAFDQIWDEMTDAEIALQTEYDPFRRRLNNIWKDLPKRHSYSMEPLARPDLETAAKLKVPVQAVGCHFTSRGETPYPPVSVTVWVRNFAGDALGYVLSADIPIKGSINPLRVAENAAFYLGIKRIIELTKKN
jgi:hypothetical protein